MSTRRTPAGSRWGRWNLGRIAEGRNDYGRALEQFQPLVTDFPGHDLAVEARLEIARIRLAGGNFDQAALYAGEAQKKAQPGGDVDRRAKELLKEIEAKRSGPAPSAAPAAPPVSAAAAPTE